MARGGIHGTFYVPEAPSQVLHLDVPLNQHEMHVVRRMDGTYEVQFLKACFSALASRIEYNMDCFYRDDNIDLNASHDINAQTKGNCTQI